ncbi:MAG: hypothetical protein KKE17_13665 [Proteobacteria bacterium]|nr:hypothetical protein [Pseudomonadota bacterium]MBU1711045.1 hypothetical protein [Pseudomonadota bacterium]
MIQDYSGRYSQFHQRQNVVFRKTGTFIADGRFSRIAGLVITVVMVFGVIASFWLGRQIDSGLQELSQNGKLNQELRLERNKLISKQNVLSAKENIEKEALKLGLRVATPDQLKASL